MRDAVGCERTDSEDDRYTKERRKSWMRNVMSVKAEARRRWMRYGGRLDWQGNEKETRKWAEDSEVCAIGSATPLDVRGRTVGWRGTRKSDEKVD